MTHLSLEARLSKKHPNLLKRFEEIAAIVENVDGNITKADDAEVQAIEQVRKLRLEIVHAWAENQSV